MTPARRDPGLSTGSGWKEEGLCSEPKVVFKVGPKNERGCGPGRPESVPGITPLPCTARPSRRPFPPTAVSSFIWFSRLTLCTDSGRTSALKSKQTTRRCPLSQFFGFFCFFVFSFELNFNEEERACAERHKHPGLLPLLPEKAPQCLDEKVISFCNRTVRTWDQRQQAWFWGERGPAGVWAGPSPVHREKPNFCLQSEAAASPLIHQGHSHCWFRHLAAAGESRQRG